MQGEILSGIFQNQRSWSDRHPIADLSDWLPQRAGPEVENGIGIEVVKPFRSVEFVVVNSDPALSDDRERIVPDDDGGTLVDRYAE